jgi:phosphatidylglycerophosphatase C
MSPTVVAAFDVDGTLTRRDSVVPFLWRVGRGRWLLGLLRRHRELLDALWHRDRDALKAVAVAAAVTGRDHAEVAAAGRAWAEEIQRSRLRSDTVARLDWHRAGGHRVVLVSASLDVYLEPLAADLGLHGVICTRLEVDGDGRCTGGLVEANCRGAEKARRLRAWIDEHHPEGATVWAYGDSAGDDALLALADHPVRVGRRAVAATPVGAAT